MNKRIIIWVIFFISIFYITIIACKKDTIDSSSSVKLDFSTNNVLFDTIFTTIGSTTKKVLIYNNNSSKIVISNISLAGGSKSNFRININGSPSYTASNIEIRAKDSLYIFIKVTIDPNNANTPFIVKDSILFNINGNLQYINLLAWGQNAYYHTPNYFYKNMPPFSIIKENDTWKNDKPHVIYGWAVVDSGSTLNIEAGAKIYLYNNAVLWIYKDGTLKVKGTLENPVYFQGTRLEQYYSDVPGQWGKIWLSAGSKNNNINYAIIKNGTIGVQVDTLGNSSQPTLNISNTIIKNMSVAGLYAQGSYIKGYNNIISNCGQYVIALTLGGYYDFRHCTFANYWQNSIRNTPLLKLNNYYVDISENIQARALNNAYFGNCIIYGNIDNTKSSEIDFDDIGNQIAFDYKFVNCLIRSNDIAKTSNQANFINCIFNQDPLFSNISNSNYELNALSPAINKGERKIINPIYLHKDIKGKSRISDTAPDIGAYEK
jgi:hypothetical protein